MGTGVSTANHRKVHRSTKQSEKLYNFPVTKKSHTDDRLKELRSRITKTPTDPGIYRWIGAGGDVLYVGKAKNLKNRLKSYVQKNPDLSIGPWKLGLIKKITDVDWTVTETELEALILETNLIKELKPKYNVLMKDDKNYVYVRIAVQDPYPVVSVIRRIKDDGGKYFGPFLSAHHIHRTLDMLHDVYGWKACGRSTDYLNRTFSSSKRIPPKRDERVEKPFDQAQDKLRELRREAERTKSKHVASEKTVSETSRAASTASIDSSAADGLARDCAQHDVQKIKPCLDFQIGKCNGLCAGKITQEEYRKNIDAMMRFFKSDRSDVLVKLKEKMQRAVEKKLFEDAAKLRDTLNYIESLEEQQVVADTSGANADYVGVALLSDKAHVVVLRERNGKLVGERSYALAGRADTHGEVLGQFLPQYYIATEEIPETIICAQEPEEREMLEAWLTEQKRRKVALRIPERGKKSKLLTMAEKNAEEKVRQQLARWEATAKKVDDALTELKDMLHLPEKPKRIECYDISHLGGTETVGSMVVFIDGQSRNNHYRSFTIRTMKKGVIDDYKALKEVLVRRLRHLTDDTKKWLKQIPITLEKKKKLYVVIHQELESAYAGHGFQYVRTAPKELMNKIEDNEIIMMLEKKKPDVSLSALPDLLVLDGGKGQLRVGVDVLKNMELQIPVISLAKREEDVFSPESPDPVPFSEDSEARFLLMRLRDEAHRCANNHREKRLKNALLKE